MKTILALLLTAAAAMPAFANYSLNEPQADILGRDPAAIVRQLADKGIVVQSVEKSGELVLANVADADGAVTIQFFDPDNGYQRVYPGGR